MRLRYGYPDQSCSSPRDSEPGSSSVEIPISSPYDPFTNYLSPRPKFLRYNPERCNEIVRRLEEVKDGFGGTSTGSNSEGSVSGDLAKQGQQDSGSDGAVSEAAMPQICSLRWLCELLLLLLVLVLFMACICNTSISSPPQNFEDWHKSWSCTYEGVSEEIVEFVEIDVSSKSIPSPSGEVADFEGRHGNSISTHDEAPEKRVEFHESGRDATRTDVDSSSQDKGDAPEWMEDEVMKGLLRESYHYIEPDEDEAAEVRDGGVWKRFEVELGESSKAADTRVEKSDDDSERENGAVRSNLYWIKKNLEPRESRISDQEVGSKTENVLLEETCQVGEATSALVGIELVATGILCGCATAVFAFALVVYSRRKKNIDSSPTTGHSFRAPPIKCPHEFAEKPAREVHLASDLVSSFPLESSPSLGSFTTSEMISTKREDETGEACINIATPVRRSSRIRDRATRSRRHLMSSS